MAKTGDGASRHGATKAQPGGVQRRDVFGLSAAGATGVVAGATGVAASASLLAPFSIRSAHAQSSASRLQTVLDRGNVLVGTGSTNPPWHFEDADGQLQGMDIDMARLVAKGLFDDPDKVEFVIGAADARIPNLVTEKVDAVFQFMTITPGRAQQVEFTIPYYREGVGFMMMQGADQQTFDDLLASGGEITISALQNVFIEDWIALALPEAKVDQYESVDTTIQAINSRRANAVALDQSTIGWLISQFPDRYVDSGYGWMPNSYAAAVKPGDQVWLNYVNMILHEAMTGVDFLSYQASFEKWFGTRIAPPAIGFPVEYK